jgi:hypothetical protein
MMMAKISDVMRGLELLAKYEPDASVDAQHDKLFAGGPGPDEMDPADASELDSLGWLHDEDDGWSRFT